MMIAHFPRPTALALLMVLPGCAGSVASYPSLAPRAVEQDPAAGQASPVVARPDASVTARAAALVDAARRGQGAFAAAAGSGCAAIARGAGAREGSEGWVAAQQVLSAIDAARSPTAAALDDLNALVLDQARLAENAPTPIDLTALTVAAAEVAALDAAQRSRLDRLRAGNCG